MIIILYSRFLYDKLDFLPLAFKEDNSSEIYTYFLSEDDISCNKGLCSTNFLDIARKFITISEEILDIELK